MVLGMAFDGHQAANLDITVKFYVTMGYPVASKTDWKVDKVANALGGTKGAESRTAIINMPSSVCRQTVSADLARIPRHRPQGLEQSDVL